MLAWAEEAAEPKVRHIGRAYQARIRGARYVDVAAPQTSRDMGGDVRVKMMLLPNVPGAASLRARMDECRGDLRQTHARLASPAGLLNVIEIVGEGGMDVGESDRRNVRHDLVGGHALVLMPHHDIEHTDAVAGDAGLSAADAGRPGDPVLGDRKST